MKNKWLTFLMFLSMILTISCAKDYNVLFNERVAELNKEGTSLISTMILWVKNTISFILMQTKSLLTL